MLATWPNAKLPTTIIAKVKNVVRMRAISQQKRRPKAPFEILVLEGPSLKQSLLLLFHAVGQGL